MHAAAEPRETVDKWDDFLTDDDHRARFQARRPEPFRPAVRYSKEMQEENESTFVDARTILFASDEVTEPPEIPRPYYYAIAHGKMVCYACADEKDLDLTNVKMRIDLAAYRRFEKTFQTRRWYRAIHDVMKNKQPDWTTGVPQILFSLYVFALTLGPISRWHSHISVKNVMLWRR